MGVTRAGATHQEEEAAGWLHLFWELCWEMPAEAVVAGLVEEAVGPVEAEALVDSAAAAAAAAEPAAVGKIYWHERVCDRCCKNRRIANIE